jgi:hypothetical protein
LPVELNRKRGLYRPRFLWQTIEAFDKEFPDEIAGKNFLIAMRWPDGVRCPRGKRKEKVYALKARPTSEPVDDGVGKTPLPSTPVFMHSCSMRGGRLERSIGTGGVRERLTVWH